MSELRNHEGQLPRVSGRHGYLMKRSRHLAPYNEDPLVRLPTYPGPGQRPDANFDTAANYDPPRDWPAAGQLLHAPQVVWLSCLTIDDNTDEYIRKLAEKRWFTWGLGSGSSQYFTGEFSAVADVLLVLFSEYGMHVDTYLGGSVDNTGGYEFDWIDGETNTYTYAHNGDGLGVQEILTELGPNIHVASGDPPKDGHGGRPYWIDTRIANPWREVYLRMHEAVFPEVKARVEALRPGRTWVDFFDWWDESTTEENWNLYWGRDDQEYMPQYLPMLCSRMDTFYGTNFLHVWIGGPLATDGTQFGGDPGADDMYAENRAVLERNAERYAGFAVKMFGLHVEFASYDVASQFPFVDQPPPGPPIRQGVGPTYVFLPLGGHESDPAPYNVTLSIDRLWTHIVPGVIAGERDEAREIVDTFNALSVRDIAARAETRDRLDAAAQAMAGDLADFGFSWLGDGVDLVVDDLVALIADHYRFDPGTGKDRS